MTFTFWNDLTARIQLNSSNLSSIRLLNKPNQSNLPLVAIPLICVFGVVANSLNILVFLNPKMKDPTFKYMLAISISNFVYTALLSYGFIIYCDECTLNKSYGTQVFKIIANNYLSSSLALFSNLVEIYLSLQRYFILTNKKNLQTISYKLVLTIIFMIASLYYVNVLFCYDIIKYEFEFNNEVLVTIYATALSDYSRSDFGKVMTVTFVMIRIILSTVVLLTINIVNLYHFRKRFKQKRQSRLKFKSRRNSIDESLPIENNKEKNELKANRNMTLLVIWTCFFYMFGATPRNVYIIVKYCLESSSRYYNFSLFTFLILIISHCINIFIYYSYNKMFRQILTGYFKSFFCLNRKKNVQKTLI